MLKIIKTENEYELALEKAYPLKHEDIVSGSEQADELELLTLLIEHHEESYCQIAPSSPIEAHKIQIRSIGQNTNRTVKNIWARIRQSEVLSGKRKLSLSMIRKPHEVFNIPAESLMGLIELLKSLFTLPFKPDIRVKPPIFLRRLQH